jgi:hypothetical protein
LLRADDFVVELSLQDLSQLAWYFNLIQSDHLLGNNFITNYEALFDDCLFNGIKVMRIYHIALILLDFLDTIDDLRMKLLYEQVVLRLLRGYVGVFLGNLLQHGFEGDFLLALIV